jgi:NAD(P)-dependent dehydrogenase (short-subunit alcohol dehydrogenase family)
LTRRLAAELIKDQINVTSLAPGAFASDMNRAARDHGDAVSKRIPNGRLGTAEDIAATAIYLASNAGNYVVGDTITIDGGVAHANVSGGSIDA